MRARKAAHLLLKLSFARVLDGGASPWKRPTEMSCGSFGVNDHWSLLSPSSSAYLLGGSFPPYQCSLIGKAGRDSSHLLTMNADSGGRRESDVE